MYWNHRVVRRVWHPGTDREETTYAIHEVFYGLSKKPIPTADPIDVSGESVEELRETLQRMLRALDKPVLDYKTGKEL
jgi:hypothetical protein